MSDEEYCGSEEAARLIGISAGTLQNWRVIGRGPAYEKGDNGRLRYRVAEVREWVEGRWRGTRWRRIEPRGEG